MPWGWPVLTVETTIHNRSIAPLYVSGFEVLSEPLLNLGMGKPTDVQMSGFERRGNSITFPERQIDPGEKLSLDFILYPNWQMLALDFPQPQPGRPGHSAGIVATFQTCPTLRSKARMRLPNIFTRTHTIDSTMIAELAALAHNKAGDKALTHWMNESNPAS
tara:strand:+ start:22375 stop:22860 length:486 start_codon:yes stop_codon:yes gene_type:complete